MQAHLTENADSLIQFEKAAAFSVQEMFSYYFWK